MKIFKKVYIEITNICNLKCDFCPQTNRKPEFMSTKMFDDVLEQIKSHTKHLNFHVKGEPLLHPELDKLLDISHEKGFKVNITTNGTLIDKVKNVLLTKPALRQINFSLHSFDGNEALIGEDEYIDNILCFVKEAIEKTEMLISLRLWNLNENSSTDIESRTNNKILEIIEKEFELTYKIEKATGFEKGVKIADRLYVNQAYQFKWPNLNDNADDADSERGFCYGLRNQAAILVDGTVVPCCLDGDGAISLGNINRAIFSDIIESQSARNIVDGFTNRKAVEELCKRCEFRKRFS